MEDGRPIAIDLFSGAGGLSKGLEIAGFHVKAAVECEAYSAETYSKNHPETKLIKEDIRKINGQQIISEAGVQEEIALLAGGPPCQGFSISNTKTRHAANPNNHLVFEFIRTASEIKPKWILMENVAGLSNFENGAVREQIIRLFEKIGYAVKCAVLNAAIFGVPQNRNRIFFVGNCIGADLNFLDEMKEKREKNPLTLRDAISDLPILENGNAVDEMKYKRGKPREYQKLMRTNSNGTVKNNIVSKNSELVTERYKYIEQGENWSAILRKKPELMSNYKDTSNCHTWIYKRLEWGKPSVAITHFRKSMLIHPGQNRGLSVREAARIQSFSDDYVFYGSISFQQQQVANAVPPLLAKAVGEEIIEQIY